MAKLNAGCGTDIRKGWINLDSSALTGVDVVHDLNIHPLPFDDKTFDEILCLDILEHVNYIDLLKEFHRILIKGGRISIRVPHFTSRYNFIDPTHKNRFSINTFYFFIMNSVFGRDYYFDFYFNKLEDLHLTFERHDKVLFYNRLVEWFFNKNYRLLDIYEKSFLRAIFPAENITLKLIK